MSTSHPCRVTWGMRKMMSLSRERCFSDLYGLQDLQVIPTITGWWWLEQVLFSIYWESSSQLTIYYFSVGLKPPTALHFKIYIWHLVYAYGICILWHPIRHRSLSVIFYLTYILSCQCYLTSILAFCLTYSLTFYLDIVFDIYSGILSDIYSGILFWHIFWHFIWHYLTYIVTVYPAFYLADFLIVYLTYILTF